MSNLRNKIIRLAHQNPNLRPHLLPLIKEASSIAEVRNVIESAILRRIDGFIQNYTGDDSLLGDYLKDNVKGVQLWGPVEEQLGANPKIEAYYKANFKRNMKALAKAWKGNNSAQWDMSFAQSKLFKGVRPKDSAYAQQMLAFLKTQHKEITGAGLVIHEIEGGFKRNFPTARVNAKLVAKDILSLMGFEQVAKMTYDLYVEAEKDPYSWYKNSLSDLRM